MALDQVDDSPLDLGCFVNQCLGRNNRGLATWEGRSAAFGNAVEQLQGQPDRPLGSGLDRRGDARDQRDRIELLRVVKDLQCVEREADRRGIAAGQQRQVTAGDPGPLRGGGLQ